MHLDGHAELVYNNCPVRSLHVVRLAYLVGAPVPHAANRCLHQQPWPGEGVVTCRTEHVECIGIGYATLRIIGRRVGTRQHEFSLEITVASDLDETCLKVR